MDSMQMLVYAIVGVVGAFDKTPDQQPVGKQAAHHQCQQNGKNQQATLQLGRHGVTRRVAGEKLANLTVFPECK